jgi:hypothetical protein
MGGDGLGASGRWQELMSWTSIDHMVVRVMETEEEAQEAAVMRLHEQRSLNNGV